MVCEMSHPASISARFHPMAYRCSFKGQSRHSFTPVNVDSKHRRPFIADQWWLECALGGTARTLDLERWK